MNSNKVKVQSLYTVTDEELMLTSSQNPELRFERNADGTLETMPPTGGISGNRELKAGAYLLNWVESQNLGEVFSSSTGFRLPNTAVRSPDAAFVAKERLSEGWDEQEDKFINLAPDFVIEIRSKNDSLEKLKAKMEEYIDNGVKLGWLIDRQNQQALVYRLDGSITQYPATAILSGEDVVPGFTLPLAKLL
ncbi:Uma2 family endonuclease [Scytonema tolypothrichoides VB-61278]|nr:Uma2 family endonuclease [Scytonema tolypothrichoides VB-61278]